MLTWTRNADGWRSNGYIIRLIEPFHWELIPAADEIAETAVTTITEPLAVARTLTECKREAELLEAAESRSTLFRRWSAQLLLALCGLVFTFGSPPPWNFLLSIALFYVAVRSGTYMVGLLTSRTSTTFGDVFTQ